MKTKLFFLLLVVLLNTQINAQCWQSIDVGQYHTVAIKTDGTLWAWGDNTDGELGDGTNISTNTPKQIGTATNWKSVSAGISHTVAIKTDGTLWAWGYNYYGQLGNGANANVNSPIQIGSATDWRSISAGGVHTMALRDASGGGGVFETLWAWGKNNLGELGDGTNNAASSPKQIGSDFDWSYISAGTDHSVALKRDGTLWTWGSNSYGQLGDGTIINKNNPTQIIVPATIPSSTWKSISGGGGHTAAIKTDGTLWIWGSNSAGQLGDGSIIEKHIPTKIGTVTTWQSITAGIGGYSLAVKTNGTLWAWGYNYWGQLGDGTNINKNIPIQIDAATNWQTIVGGFEHSVAIKTDGSLSSWGGNYSGELGDGTNIKKNTPTQINCTALGTEKVTVNDNSFSIYPNPVNDIFHIQSSDNQFIDKIVITDLAGKKVLEQKGNNKQMNVQQLQQGMYLLQVFSEGKSSQTKFIKQ